MSIKLEEIKYKEIEWALQNDVHVTLIDHDPNGIRTIFLVSRIYLGPLLDKRYIFPHDHALVLEFSDDPFLLINGRNFEEANAEGELIKWCTLVDAVSLSPHFPTPGDYVATRWEDGTCS